ncbi:hypothetical protein Mgra_00007874 [Meloidogyne graminicola]|uniref:Uncharacterized protein n=1 Tax=Meloidogyne graminicola TaxID=189291 RepID=A0A8S9ZHB6_9BILA|nr:hypothetical protein Mgra_00007874 [Meloidogyne graminicola]
MENKNFFGLKTTTRSQQEINYILIYWFGLIGLTL